MARARHKSRSGNVTVNAGADSPVLKEARERKRGGAVSGEGDAAPARADRRARGGSVGAAVTPGRKRGGSVGSNNRPLSSAASVSKVSGEIAGGPKGESVPNP